jgi:hypothetical protein
MLLLFWVFAPNVSQKRTVSIFRAEMALMWTEGINPFQPWRWILHVSLERCCPPTILHGMTAQKTNIDNPSSLLYDSWQLRGHERYLSMGNVHFWHPWFAPVSSGGSQWALKCRVALFRPHAVKSGVTTWGRLVAHTESDRSFCLIPDSSASKCTGYSLRGRDYCFDCHARTGCVAAVCRLDAGGTFPELNWSKDEIKLSYRPLHDNIL